MKLVFENESDFKKELMLEEVEALNKEFPLEDNKFDFKINFIVENENDYEVEFYFRNNKNTGLSLKKLPVHFIYNDVVIAIQMIDFRKEFGIIEAKSVKACSFKIDKENVYYPEDMQNSKLVLGLGTTYGVNEVLHSDVANIPKDISYDQEIYLKEKIKELPVLTADSYNINCLTLAEDGNGDVNVVLLVRNGHNHDIKVFELPIQILNEIKIPIYIGLFNPNDMTVKSRESKLYLIKIAKSDFIKTYDDYSDFEVRIG